MTPCFVEERFVILVGKSARSGFQYTVRIKFGTQTHLLHGPNGKLRVFRTQEAAEAAARSHVRSHAGVLR